MCLSCTDCRDAHRFSSVWRPSCLDSWSSGRERPPHLSRRRCSTAHAFVDGPATLCEAAKNQVPSVAAQRRATPGSWLTSAPQSVEEKRRHLHAIYIYIYVYVYVCTHVQYSNADLRREIKPGHARTPTSGMPSPRPSSRHSGIVRQSEMRFSA